MSQILQEYRNRGMVISKCMRSNEVQLDVMYAMYLWSRTSLATLRLAVSVEIAAAACDAEPS